MFEFKVHYSYTEVLLIDMFYLLSIYIIYRVIPDISLLTYSFNW